MVVFNIPMFCNEFNLGSFLNGLFHGYGIMEKENGDVYSVSQIIMIYKAINELLIIPISLFRVTF